MRADQVDYSPTLGQISQNLLAATQRVDAMAKSPLLSLTPAAVGAQVEKIAANARHSERQAMAAAQSGFDEAARVLTMRVGSALTRDEQSVWLAGSAAAGLIAGILLWMLMTGPIARAMPASWQWPEGIAAGAMGMPMWDAGLRLMAAAEPDRYARVVGEDHLIQANAEVVAACRKTAAKTRKAVRCRVKIEP